MQPRVNRCDYCNRRFTQKDGVSDDVNSRYRRVHIKCREEVRKLERRRVTFD